MSWNSNSLNLPIAKFATFIKWLFWNQLCYKYKQIWVSFCSVCCFIAVSFLLFCCFVVWSNSKCFCFNIGFVARFCLWISLRSLPLLEVKTWNMAKMGAFWVLREWPPWSNTKFYLRLFDRNSHIPLFCSADSALNFFAMPKRVSSCLS